MADNQDPLNCNLTTIDTSRKILAADRMNLIVVETEIKATKDNTGRMISLKLKTADPKPSIKGETIEAGHYIMDQVMLNPTGAATWDMVTRRLGELVQASRITGEIRPSNADLWHKQLEGRTLIAQVDYEPASTAANGKTYEEKNVIAKYLKQ